MKFLRVGAVGMTVRQGSISDKWRNAADATTGHADALVRRRGRTRYKGESSLAYLDAQAHIRIATMRKDGDKQVSSPALTSEILNPSFGFSRAHRILGERFNKKVWVS